MSSLDSGRSTARFTFALLSFLALSCATRTASAAANWVDYAERNSVAYFLFQSPQQIARYDLAQKQPLTALPLPRVASALHVDETGVYYAAQNQVFRRNGDG